MAPRLWKRSHPVHEAVKFGRHDIRRLRQLLESNKVDVNTKDANGATPLHIAVSSKAGEALKLLLAHASIDPNAQDANGKTALHMAISSNCTDNVRKLLEHPRTNVSLSDNEGRSPLHYAVEAALSPTEGEGMLSLLLRHGPVHHEAQDNYQRTALSWALHLGLEAAVVALISDREPVSEVGVTDVDGNTALHKADGRAWDSAVLVRLLAHQDKAVVNAKNRFSETALHIAARADRDTFLGPFISAGADLEARRDSDGATPFHVAVQYGSYEFASGLWSPGMRRLAFVKDCKGNTPLHLAAARGDVRMVASIVGRDELVAQVNNEQEAAVDVAARHGHAEAVVVLLRAETVESEAVRSKRRDTAFRMLPQIVEGSHVSTLIEWLAWEGLLNDLKSVRAHDDAPLPKQCITLAAERGHAHVVQYLVDEGVDPNTCLHLVGTPLAVAAKHGQVGVLKFLISLEQIKPDLGLQGGDTPLMSAIRSRSAASVAVLLSDEAIRGRHLSLTQGDKWKMKFPAGSRWRSNPLLLAAELGYDEIVSMLLRADLAILLDLNVQDLHGRTPLLLACARGHWRVVKLLLQAHFRNTINSVPGAETKSMLDVELADDKGKTPLSYAWWLVAARDRQRRKAVSRRRP